jgi:hypothetical protein
MKGMGRHYFSHAHDLAAWSASASSSPLPYLVNQGDFMKKLIAPLLAIALGALIIIPAEQERHEAAKELADTETGVMWDNLYHFHHSLCDKYFGPAAAKKHESYVALDVRLEYLQACYNEAWNDRERERKDN